MVQQKANSSESAQAQTDLLEQQKADLHLDEVSCKIGAALPILLFHAHTCLLLNSYHSTQSIWWHS